MTYWCECKKCYRVDWVFPIMLLIAIAVSWVVADRMAQKYPTCPEAVDVTP